MLREKCLAPLKWARFRRVPFLISYSPANAVHCGKYSSFDSSCPVGISRCCAVGCLCVSAQKYAWCSGVVSQIPKPAFMLACRIALCFHFLAFDKCNIPPTSQNCEIRRLGVADVYLLIFTFDGVYSPFATLVWGGQCIWVEMTAVFREGTICSPKNRSCERTSFVYRHMKLFLHREFWFLLERLFSLVYAKAMWH